MRIRVRGVSFERDARPGGRVGVDEGVEAGVEAEVDDDRELADDERGGEDEPISDDG